jgi:hypothetical protein
LGSNMASNINQFRVSDSGFRARNDHGIASSSAT